MKILRLSILIAFLMVSANTYGQLELTILSDLLNNKLEVRNNNAVNDYKVETIAKADYVLVYFSAKWCPGCKQFTPKLVNFYNTFYGKPGPRFEVIFVSLDKIKKQMDSYVKQFKMPWPYLKYDEREMPELMRLAGPGIPCIVVIDRQGKVVLDSFDKTKNPQRPEYKAPEAILNEFIQLLKTGSNK